MDDPAQHEFLQTHRAHDPDHVIERWRRIAPQAGLELSVFARAGDHELHVLRSKNPPPDARRIYLSTGVHGDEPAGPLGLLHWAEDDPSALRANNFLIFPCINPWGLIENVRHDARGRDLNRLFHSRGAPFVEWRRELGDERFDLVLCLHEDFDARGCYIYELGGSGRAEALLKAAEPYIQADASELIDDSPAVGGVIRREDMTPELFPLEGLPDTVWLYFKRCGECLTFETPSEFCLFARVQAHAAMIKAALR